LLASFDPMFIAISGFRFRRRLIQLVLGLVMFGIGIGLMLDSGLGLPPWDVLHQGLAERFGGTVGVWSILISVLVLLLWFPLRERFGLGTLLNFVIIGVAIDLTSALVPDPGTAWAEWAMLLGGVFLIGISSGMYIGANLGPGPRDGLMTGISKYGPSIRLTRFVLEAVVLAAGWLLGGTFGVGTVIFAVTIGPIVHFYLPRWTIRADPAHDDPDAWVHPAR